MRNKKSKPLPLKPFERAGGYGDSSSKFCRLALDDYYEDEAGRIIEEFATQGIKYDPSVEKSVRGVIKDKLKLSYEGRRKISLRALIRRWLGLKTKEEQLYEYWLLSVLKRFRMKKNYGMVEEARWKRGKADVVDEGGK